MEMKSLGELRYPIKYVIMQIKEQQSEWNCGQNGEAFNIVVKAYVVGESIKKVYFYDGTESCDKIYEVVFSHSKKDIEYYGECERVVPEYLYGQYSNSHFVNQVFSTFEEAIAVATRANCYILNQMIGLIPYDENFLEEKEKIEKRFQVKAKLYHEIEQKIKNESMDMLVTKDQEKNTKPLLEEILENPSDFYKKAASILSLEEKEFIRGQIQNKSCNNCMNDSCKVESSEKSRFDFCVAWDNEELIGMQRILNKNNF